VGRRKIGGSIVTRLEKASKAEGRILNGASTTIEGVYFICIDCKKVCHNMDDGLSVENVNRTALALKRKGFRYFRAEATSSRQLALCTCRSQQSDRFRAVRNRRRDHLARSTKCAWGERCDAAQEILDRIDVEPPGTSTSLYETPASAAAAT
jgi:hypothetical protein